MDWWATHGPTHTECRLSFLISQEEAITFGTDLIVTNGSGLLITSYKGRELDGECDNN